MPQPQQKELHRQGDAGTVVIDGTSGPLPIIIYRHLMAGSGSELGGFAAAAGLKRGVLEHEAAAALRTPMKKPPSAARMETAGEKGHETLMSNCSGR